MRPSFALLLCLALAGCPSPKPPVKPLPAEPVQATPVPTPTPLVEASPTPLPVAVPIDFNGVWTTTDDQGQVFDILIFPNGQTVTDWTKGKDGADGKRGLWRREGARLVIFYVDGSSNIVEATADGAAIIACPAGVPLDRPSNISVSAHRASGDNAKYIGVWRLNKEPDGTYQYLSLQSNGRAFSSVNGGTEGRWAVANGGAECTWPDGWIDRIESTTDGWQKRSSVGSGSDAPADLSPATRVGETLFEVAP